MEVLRIVTYPPEKQLELWNAYIDNKRRHNKRGKERKPGVVKLEKYLHAVDGITNRSGDFRRGLKLGLSIALGKDRWTFTQEKKEHANNGIKED
jgi:hypothetical protein